MDIIIEQKLLDFFGKFKKIHLRKNQILLYPEKKTNEVFLLVSGTIKCYSVSPEGLEMLVNVYKPLSFFPMNTVINNSKNRYFYESITPTDLYTAPKEIFLKFFREDPDLVYDLLSRIYSGLEGYMLRMESLLGGSAYLKLLVHLVIQARRDKGSNGAEISLHLSHKYLASETGLTRETVTREIKKLKDKKLVSSKGSVLIIPDLMALESELSLNL